jgi:hypothetical protein
MELGPTRSHAAENASPERLVSGYYCLVFGDRGGEVMVCEGYGLGEVRGARLGEMLNLATNRLICFVLQVECMMSWHMCINTS